MAYSQTFPFAELVLVMDECLETGRFSIIDKCLAKMQREQVTIKDVLFTIENGHAMPALEKDRITFVTDDLICSCALGHDYPDASAPHVFLLAFQPALNGVPVRVTRSINKE